MAIIVNGERIEDQEIQLEVQRLRPSYEQAFADKDPAEREAQLIEWSKENVVERVLLRQEAKTSGDARPGRRSRSRLHAPAAAIREARGPLQGLQRRHGRFDQGDDRNPNEGGAHDQRRLRRRAGAFRGRDSRVLRPEQGALHDGRADSGRPHRQIRQLADRRGDRARRRHAGPPGDRRRQPVRGGRGQVHRLRRQRRRPRLRRAGQLVEEFEDVVFHLSVGQVSDVFRSRFGFHIAKLYDRRPSAIPPLKAIRGEIVDEVKEQKREQALGDYLDALRSKAGRRKFEV